MAETPNTADPEQVADALSKLEAAAGIGGGDDGGEGKPSSGPAGAGKTPERKALTGKQLVKWGETEREYDIDELVARARKAEQADSVMEAAKQLVSRSQAGESLAKMIEGLTPQRQQKLKAIFQNPALLDGGGDDDEDPEIAALLGNGSSNGNGHRQGRDPEFDAMKAALNALVQKAIQDEQKSSQESLTTRVNKAVDSFKKALEEDPEGLELVREHVLLKAALDRNVSIEDEAAAGVARLAKMIRSARTNALTPRTPDGRYTGGGKSFPSLASPEKPPTGSDLSSGKIRENLEKLLR